MTRPVHLNEGRLSRAPFSASVMLPFPRDLFRWVSVCVTEGTGDAPAMVESVELSPAGASVTVSVGARLCQLVGDVPGYLRGSGDGIVASACLGECGLRLSLHGPWPLAASCLTRLPSAVSTGMPAVTAAGLQVRPDGVIGMTFSGLLTASIVGTTVVVSADSTADGLQAVSDLSDVPAVTAVNGVPVTAADDSGTLEIRVEPPPGMSGDGSDHVRVSVLGGVRVSEAVGSGRDEEGTVTLLLHGTGLFPNCYGEDDEA